jgi:cell shape-determining protein MreC
VASVPVGRRRLLILLVITALVLLTFDQRGNRVIDGARTGFIGVTSPLRSLARVVASPARNAWYGLTRYDSLKQENDDLRDRIEAQDGAAIAAEAVVYENQELKSEFGLPTLSEIARVKAEVISGPPSNFDQTITINQGSRKGVAVGMPVITSGGLVGRIEQVTDGQSVVRLLSDPESTVGVRFASAPCSTSAPAETTTTTAPPADPNALPTSPAPPPADPAAAAAAAAAAATTVPATGAAAPLVGPEVSSAVAREDTELGRVRGRGRGKPLEVEQVNAEACIAKGDGVITAGVTESLFPRGIPIGRVSLVERRAGSLDLLVRVDPVVDLQRLSIVQVLLYDGDAAYSKG